MFDLTIEIQKPAETVIPLLRVTEYYENGEYYPSGIIRKIDGGIIFQDDRFGSLILKSGMNLVAAAKEIRAFIQNKMAENPDWNIDFEDEAEAEDEDE